MKFFLKAAAAAAILAMPAAVSAQGYDVYVGYADGLRGPVTFPDPWFGGANVQFFSGFSAANPDAGAIMIQNTSGVTIFLQAIEYSLNPGPATYSFSWAFGGGPLALDPGKFAIFTGQNNSGDFDTSDINVGPCGSPNTNAPHLDITVGGSAAGFNDTGHILDTGGVDEANCNNFGRGGNESLGWRKIGTTGTDVGGNQVAPEPSTIILTASGLVGLAGYVRRRRAQA